MASYLATLCVVCLAGEALHGEAQTQDHTRRQISDAQTTDWTHDPRNLRNLPDYKTFETRQHKSKENSEWWLRYASKLHLNRSGSSELRERRGIRDGLGNVGFYAHLDGLTHDMLDALSLTFLRVYTNGGHNDTLFLQKVARHPGQSWAAWPCSDDALPSGLHQELIMVLCDNTATDKLLTKATEAGVLTQHVWLLLRTTSAFRDRATHLYLPIDSQVMEIVPELEGGSFTLYEMWSPGGSVALKTGLAGIWTANSDFRGRTTHYPWTIATARLRLYPQPMYERRSNLTGVHFIVTSINDTRAQKSHFDKALGREVLTGYFGDVWELFRAEMNFTYSVITPADGEFGSLSKGRWTGLIGDVLSGRAHVIVAQLSQTYSRAQVIDYSSVLIRFSYRIFARPQARSAVSWSSYTRPFSKSLWIGLGLTIVILGAIFCCIAHWYLHQEMQKTKAGVEKRTVWLTHNREAMKYRLWKKDSFLLMWAAFTQQGWPDPPEPDSLHILFWIVYMVGVVVVAAYSATLVSFLTVVDEGLPFESLTDLKQLRTHRLGILKGSVLEEFFKSQGFQEYWNALIEPYSDTLATSYDELRSLASRDPDFAYVGSYEIQRLDPVGACIFHSARQHLLFNDGALGWPNGSPYTGIFDFYIIRLRESGVLQKLARKWYPSAYSCVNSLVMPLGFQQVFTAFVALGFGAGLSILFLSGEKTFFQRSTYSNRNQSSTSQITKIKSSGLVS